MSSIGNVMEILKTGKGKLFAALFALAIIFTFTGIAYGTSAVSLGDADEPAVQSDAEPVLTVAAESEQTEIITPPGETTAVVEEGEEDLIEDEPVVPEGPFVDKDGIVTFKWNVDQATISHDGANVTTTSAIVVDPLTIENGQHFTFAITPTDGYEVTSVMLVSTFNERAKPYMPATPIEDESSQSVITGVPYDELSDAMKAALSNDAELTLSEDQLIGEPEAGTTTLTYSIDDMQLFAGRDVTITITTKEVQYDAWYKIVAALAAGKSVQLADKIEVGKIPEEQDASKVDSSLVNAQAVVNPSADDSEVVLDLNGHNITVDGSLDSNVDSLFLVNPNASFTIIDKGTKAIALRASSSDGTLIENGAVMRDRVGKETKRSDNGLTYSVTLSYVVAKGSTSEKLYENTLTIPTSGTIEAQSGGAIKNLISVSPGAFLSVEGGIYTNKSGRALMNNSGTVKMTGGAIVDCSLDGDSGAGIFATGGTTTIDENGVVAGNSVNGDDENWNGGGISVKDGTLNIKGNSLIVGNRVVGEYNSPNVFNYNSNGTGGGIYAIGSSVTISGSSRIASNSARFYGGGINSYNSSVVVSENAVITHNKTTYSHTDADNKGLKVLTVGGGGIHFAGENTLNVVGGQITANYSSDGGGGIYVSQNTSTFLMSGERGNLPIIASNYAYMSEGGGLFLSSSKSSKIKAGYITNNATETPYDFGGGGLYVSGKSQQVEVCHPVVTNNTAYAFGGGVANCQNGMTLSDKAAIFDNVAIGKGSTNSSVEVDDWIKQLGISADMANDYVGGKRSIIYSSMLGGNFYNWKGYMSVQPQTTVVNVSGLSGKNFTVKGSKYQTDIAKSNVASIIRYASDDIDYIQIPIKRSAITSNAQNSGISENELLNRISAAVDGSYIDVNGWLDLSNGSVDKTNNNANAHLKGIADVYTGASHPKDSIKESSSYISSYGDWFLTSEMFPTGPVEYWYLRVSVDANAAKPVWSSLGYTKNIWSVQPVNDSDKNDAGWSERDLLYRAVDDTDGVITYVPTWHGLEPYKVLNAAKTNTGNTNNESNNYTITVNWPIAKITDFPKNGYAATNRLMCLTAYPDQSAKSAALACGRLFITGNYSNTNGGGIANNGNITIGEDPGNPPEEDDDDEYLTEGEFELVKTFSESFDAMSSGSALATFSVAQYKSNEAVAAGDAVNEDIVTFSFAEAGKQTYTWPGNVSAGDIFVITELDVDGDNAAVDPVIGSRQIVHVVYGDESETEDILDEAGNVIGQKQIFKARAVAEFTNSFSDQSYLTSVINHYFKDGENFGFTPNRDTSIPSNLTESNES